MAAQNFEMLFFYAFKKEERMQGYMKPGQYKRIGDTTELYIGITILKLLIEELGVTRK